MLVLAGAITLPALQGITMDDPNNEPIKRKERILQAPFLQHKKSPFNMVEGASS